MCEIGTSLKFRQRLKINILKYLILSIQFRGGKSDKVEMMNAILRITAIVSVIAGIHSSGAKAAVVFSDNFDNYAYQLNWAPQSNWTAPGPGTVDLIGETTTETAFNFYPGNGGYVDLEGSNGLSGKLQTVLSFLPGTYTLTFDLGGNARDDATTTTVLSLGSFSASI